MNKQMKRVMRDIEQEQYWPPIQHPISSEDALSRLTKDELTEIRKRFSVSGASSLKKQELAGVLAVETLRELPYVLALMDQTRYDVLKKVANKDGAAAVEADILMIRYFEGLGILFRGSISGENVVVMPQELLEAFRMWDTQDYQAMVRRNTEWILLAQGLLHYYGVLSWEEMKQFVMQYTGADNEDYTLFELVIRDSGDYQASLAATRDIVAHADVMDSGLVREEQAQRAELPFYPLTKQQVLQASDPRYIEKTPSFQALVKYLMQQYGMTRAEAEEEADLIVYDIKLGDSPSQMLESIQDKFELADESMVRDFIRLLSELMNNTRLWFLKGHTPSEAGAILRGSSGQSEPAAPPPGGKAEVYQFATKQKVGRNDPCPCGSGKKFKKCCGS
jgi:hypothetical protein